MPYCIIPYTKSRTPPQNQHRNNLATIMNIHIKWVKEKVDKIGSCQFRPGFVTK